MENTSVIASRSGAKRCLYLQKGGTRGFCDGTVLNLDGGGGYMNTHMLKDCIALNTHIHTCM